MDKNHFKAKIKDNSDWAFFSLMSMLCSLSIFLIWKYPIAMLRPQYAKYADLILSSTNWLYSIDYTNCLCGEGLSDITTYRSIGYPIVIALNKLIFGAYQIYGILFAQLILWFYSAYAFWGFSKEFGLKDKFRLIFIFSYLTGWGWFIQHDCMSDALFTSLFTLLVINIGKLILRDELYNSFKNLKIGFLLLGLYLIREVTLQISILFLATYAIQLLNRGTYTSLKKLIKSAFLFYLPIVSFALIQGCWNYYRTGGEFFINLGAKSALLPRIEHAIIVDNSALKDNLLFDEFAKDRILKQIHDQKLQKLNLNEFYFDFSIIRHNKNHPNLSQPKLTELVKKEYARLWFHYPKVMLYISLKDLIFFKDLMFIFRPLESIEDYYLYYQRFFGSNKKLPHLSDLSQLSISQWQDLLFVLFVNACRLISVIIYGMFLFMFGMAASRITKNKGKIDNKDQVILFQTLVYTGYILAYAVIHIEARYLAAVFSLPAFIGIYGWQNVLQSMIYNRQNKFQQRNILKAA